MSEESFYSSENGDCLEDIGVSQFEIVILNNHNKTYFPGQYVEGHVIAKLEKSFVTRGILLQFCGRAGIYWTEKQRGAENKCIGTMDYRAQEEFFNIRHFVFEPGLIPSDVHKFPFKFFLTPPLPDNYKDNLCEIEYFLEARIKLDTDTQNDIIYRQDILLVDPIDLNKVILPDVTMPVHTQKMLKLGLPCCRSPPIICFMRLTRSGYSPGEVIHVQADIENNSSSTVHSVEFILYEERIYKTEHKVHRHRDAISKVVEKPVKGKSTKQWSDIPLPIPRQQVFNVAACKIFHIKHTLEMQIKAGLFSKSLVVPLRIVIGSVPLDSVSKETLPLNRLHQKPSAAQLKERQVVIDATRRSREAPIRDVNTRKNKIHRQRRKDRNKKVYPEDLIDTADYYRK